MWLNWWIMCFRLKKIFGSLHSFGFLVACLPSMNVWSICGFSLLVNWWLQWLRLKKEFGIYALVGFFGGLFAFFECMEYQWLQFVAFMA